MTPRHVLVRLIRASRSGVTLIEVLVVLAILAVVAATAGVGLRDWDLAPPGTHPFASIDSLRRAAISSGTPATGVVGEGSNRTPVTALPDGQLVGAEQFGYDALSGRRDPVGDSIVLVK